MEDKADIEKMLVMPPREKYSGLKRLLLTAKENPKKLYGQFNSWTRMLDSENNIVKWTAIDIIGNLSAADTKNRIDKKLLHRISDLLRGGRMITANHAVYALALIARNKPVFANEILDELLSVSGYSYETAECKNIVTGKVILALADLKNEWRNNKKALQFIEKACGNTRNATRKKALQLLKELK